MRPLERYTARLAARPDFQAWNADNALRSADGLPTVWLHGTFPDTDFDVFAIFDEASIGFHFGGPVAAQARIEQVNACEPEDERLAGALMPVYIRARNPLRLRDHYTWRLDRVAGEMLDLGVIDEAEYDLIADSCSCERIFAALELAGHDAVLYSNDTEGGLAEDSVFVWRAEQIKGAFAAAFDPADPRLTPQRPACAEDLRLWRRMAADIEAAKRDILAVRAARVPEAPGPR